MQVRPAAVRLGPERLHWITSRRHPIDFGRDSLSLAYSSRDAFYRNRAIDALETAGRG